MIYKIIDLIIDLKKNDYTLEISLFLNILKAEQLEISWHNKTKLILKYITGLEK